jgi:hypothetical protein
MQNPETILPQNSNLDQQIETIRLATGIDITGKGPWEPTTQPPQPPKALWQTLMTRYALETGISIGDPTVRLYKSDDLWPIWNRFQSIKNAEGEPWSGICSWRDPLNWGITNEDSLSTFIGKPAHTSQLTTAKISKMPLWKRVDCEGPKVTSWGTFTRELQQFRKNIDSNPILKTFSQNGFTITNLQINAGSLWKNPEGWSIRVELLETTDAREGDEKIPRGFLIASKPELCIVCGDSTENIALEFLINNIKRLKQIITFWTTLHTPPAVIECMSLEGKLAHVNDLAIDRPKPMGSMEQALKEYAEKFIHPLYGNHAPNIAEELDHINNATWVTAKAWNKYKTAKNIELDPIVDEGHNWKARARGYGNSGRETNDFETRIRLHRKFRNTGANN